MIFNNLPKLKENVIIKKKKITGYIYVFKLDNHYKIGVTSRTPEKRLNNMMTSSPKKIIIYFSYKHCDIYKEEDYLHKIFNEVRIRGEWFELSKQDLVFIKNRAKNNGN